MFQNNLLMGAAANASSGASVVSVGNSALFLDAVADGTAGQALTKTFSGSPSSTTTGTFSVWFNVLSDARSTFFTVYPSGVSLQIALYQSKIYIDLGYSSASHRKQTTQVIRDYNAWYHLVITFDTSNAIDNDRIRIYLNGERITDLGTFNESIAVNSNICIGAAASNIIGRYDANYYHFNGYMAECVYLDGQAKEPTSFGAYDSSGLFWTPLASDTIKELTFGNNGWYLDNTTNAQTDASGEGNNFTNTGSITTNPHSPTNSYAIQNPLTITNSYPSTLADGNLKQTGNSGGSFASGTLATLPCDGGGKFYWEAKAVSLYSTSSYITLGVSPMDLPRFNNTDGNGNFCLPGQQDYQGVSITFNGASYTNLRGNSLAVNSNIVSALTIATNDFMQIAFDSATQKVWFGKNNSWYNSGNPAGGSNETITLTATDKTWFPWFGTYTASDTWQINYGATDFEYTPPSGFEKVNTTQIASDTTRTASDTNKYFQTVLYEGNGDSQRVGAFQPFTDTYTIAKSALFNSANTEYFSRTFGSGGDTTDWGYSLWFKYGKEATDDFLLSAGVHSSTTWTRLMLDVSGGKKASFDFTNWNSSGTQTGKLVTTAKFQDASIWNHVLITWDSDNGTAGDRMRMYINGNRVTEGTFTNPSSGEASGINAAVAHMIGSYNAASGWADGYMADVAFIDGFNSAGYGPANFGQTDTSTNRWVPKDISGLTYANTSFRLDFSNGSDLGEDQENSNDWTNNNTVTQSTDSPTTNYAVLDPNQTTWGAAVTLSAGNLTAEGTSTTLTNNITSTLTMYSGKYVYAFKPDSVLNLEGQAGIVNDSCYIARSNNLQDTTVGTWSAEFNGSVSQFAVNQNGTRSTLTPNSNYEVGDYIIVALDVDNMLVWVGHYDASTDTTKWYNASAVDWTGNPATGTGGMTIYGNWFKFSAACYTGRGGVADFGQNGLLSNIDIPTGFSYLTQDNLASTDQYISALSWIKNRDASDNNMWFDRVRGVTKDLHSNTTDIEVTNVETVQQFLAAGVQIGVDHEVNTANESYALWNFMMEATGSGSSLTGGDINTTALVDTTLGMAVGTYSGSNSNQTIETGVTNPKMVIIKRLDATYAWAVWHEGLTDDYNILLNTAAGQVDSDYFDTSENTSTLFHLLGNSNATSIAGGNFVYMAFADSQFISVGSYRGNEDVNGTFVPTLNSLGIPIQPVWVMVKNSVQARSWNIIDTVRNPYNVSNYVLEADTTTAQQTGNTSLWSMDIVTGGFKLRSSHETSNGAETMIYLAIGTPIIDTDGRIIAGR